MKTPDRHKRYSITLKPGIFVGFAYVAIALTVLNLAGIFFQKMLGFDNFFTKALVYFFDASLEYNIPALFSTLLLFIASILLFINYSIPDAIHQKHNNFWLVLGIIFLFLSIDEATVIHERFKLSERPEDLWTWIIPYGLFALIVGLLFIRFLLSLPPRTRKLILIAGIIYVLATAGFEPVENHVMSVYGPTHKYFLLCAVEEFLEMAGIIIFNYALLDYISFYNISIKITQRKGKLVNNERKQMSKTRMPDTILNT